MALATFTAASALATFTAASLVPAGVSGGLVEGGQEAFDAGIQHAVRLRGIHGSAHAALSPAHVRGQRIGARGQAGCALFALKCIARVCTISRTISSGTSHSLALRSTAAPGNRQLLRLCASCLSRNNLIARGLLCTAAPPNSERPSHRKWGEFLLLPQTNCLLAFKGPSDAF